MPQIDFGVVLILLVVWFGSPDVCGTVYTPCEVEGHYVSGDSLGCEGIVKIVTPA